MKAKKDIQIIEVPYHIGFRDEGMAQGPGDILATGLVTRLQEAGFVARHTQALRPEPADQEPAAILGVNRAVRDNVAAAFTAGRFPLVLSGGCSASLGVLAAMDTSRTGVIWFDAHGDYNTPETTPSGYFGGMPLAVANGLGNQGYWIGLTDQPVIQSTHTILIGIRDLDPGEQESLQNSGATIISGEMFATGIATQSLREVIKEIGTVVEQIYLHLDIDVLDPEIVPGVTYPSPSGLTREQLSDAQELIGRTLPVRAASLTAFNPAKDNQGKSLHIASRLAMEIAEQFIH